MIWNCHKVEKIQFNDGVEIEVHEHLRTSFQNYQNPPQNLEVGLYEIPATGSWIAYWNGETWLNERVEFLVTEFSIDKNCPEWYREHSETLLACHYRGGVAHQIKVNE